MIQVVVKKNFVAVVAQEEWQAIEAAAALKVRWNTAPLPSYATFYDDLQKMSPTTNRVLIDTLELSYEKLPIPDTDRQTLGLYHAAAGSASAQALALLATIAAEEGEPVRSFQSE